MTCPTQGSQVALAGQLPLSVGVLAEIGLRCHLMLVQLVLAAMTGRMVATAHVASQGGPGVSW
jgi:hypothetical protein